VVDNLARTARLVAADTALLDTMAAEALTRARRPGGGLSVPVLGELPDPVRTRVLHAWARELGGSGSALSHRHVAALDALVTGWRGQGPTQLPGGISVVRRAGELVGQA
jgi:tRNA(Ile)-lysidine synthase